jgi:N-acetylglucosamine kinase-like BadF-type ATPase
MHVLGIDAGGTKTVGYLAGDDGTVLAEARGGAANLQVAGERGAERVLRAVMEQALGGGAVPPDAICLGMAGADREADGRVLRGILRRIGGRARTLVVNDALLALVAGVKDAPGIVIICGTGSIAYGRSGQGVAARSGGWGHLLGDEGSGYWIGLRALRAVARAADGRGPATGLTARLQAHFGVPRPSDLIPALYDRRKVALPTVAALCPHVEAERAAGDGVAAGILEAAVGELLAAGSSVTARLGMREEPFAFILAGGVFAGVPWLGDQLSGRLPAIAPRCTVSRLAVEPALGAVRLALAEARGGAKVPPYLD